MSPVKFVRHPDFPEVKCFYTSSRYFWKMELREWAFAKIDVENLISGNKGTTNNPTIISPHDALGEKALTTTEKGGGKATLKFYANQSGSSYVQIFDKDPFFAVDKVIMLVQVFPRRANKPEAISLTKLEGKTVAINAPDAQAYKMEKTIIFDGQAVDPLSFFSGVPSGANHVVIASHGGTIGEGDSSKISMFVGGLRLTSVRLDIGNVEEVFKTLKGKVADNCVVWFGGCNIGMNNDFCSKAATASGCYVVAPVMPLMNKTFPQSQVDLLDNVSMPKAFAPSDGKPISINDFCAKQESLKFVVPI